MQIEEKRKSLSRQANRNDKSPKKTDDDIKEKAPNILFFDKSSDSEPCPLENYKFGSQIGQGAYAIVRKALHRKTNKSYAIKIYDKTKLTDTNR